MASKSEEIANEILKQVQNDLLTGPGGGALNASVATVDHDVPTDENALREKRLSQADDAIEAARRKVIKQKQFVADATGAKKDKQRAHLKDAEQAVAEAIAAKKRLADRPATTKKKGRT